MPRSRHHRDYDYDNSDYESSRGRRPGHARPRAHHRSSSYDDRYRYGSRPRTSRRYHDDIEDDDTVYDSYDDYASSRPRRRHTRSEVGARRHRSRGRSRSRSRSTSRSLSLSREYHDEIGRQKRDQAIRSALTAGAVEAFRQRNRPGDWMGEKGLRVATAAMSAAAIDTAVDKDPRRKGKRNVIGSTLGGLFVDKVAGKVLGGRR